MLFRERNRQYAVPTALLSGIEELGHILTDLLPPAPDEATYRRRHEGLASRFDQLRKVLEEEIFEERYMEHNIRAEAERERIRRAEEIERAARDKRALERVKSWSEE